MERARPEDWYRIRPVGDGVTFIDEPHIVEYFRCNLWHVRGRDRDMLIDSGMGVVPLRRYVPLVTERRCIAVASHTHYDHIGSHHEFEERLVHANEAELIARPTRENLLIDPYVTDEIFTQLPPEPYRSTEYSVRGAPATRILRHGDIIDLGERRFEVLHTPGHSPGGIALWEKDSGILFSGDVLYDGPLIEDLYHSNLEDYIASMKMLHDIPVRVVHGGHFPSFGGEKFRSLIRAWLDSKGV